MVEANTSQSKAFSLATTVPFFNSRAANLGVEWKNWCKQFKIFLLASNLDTEADKRKVALLLHYMGSESLPIFNSFNVDISDVKYSDLLTKFEKYFTPKVNLAMERHAFFTRRQGSEESIVQYATALENLSSSCEFGALRESLLKDIYTCGLSENYRNIKERLLGEGVISWMKALEISKTIEMAKENVATIHKSKSTEILLPLCVRRTKSISIGSQNNR